MALQSEGSVDSENEDNLLTRWIEAAKVKREEYVRSQPIRTPLQVIERDPSYVGESQTRSCTDVFGLVFLSALLIVWIAGIVYCAQYSDIGRIKQGYDSCGFVCGKPPNCSDIKLNKTPVGIDCNFSCSLITEEEKLVEFQKADSIVYNPDEINRTCVSRCSPGFVQILSKCIPIGGTEIGNTIFHLVGYEKAAREIAEDLFAAWPYLAVTILVCAGLSLSVVPALRYFALYAIWLVLVTALVFSVAASVYCWTLFVDASSLRKVDEHGRDQKYTYLFTSVGATMATINIVILTVAVKPKVKWVAELFMESAKAKISLPRLIMMPVATFLLVCVLFFLSCYLVLMIESSGHLQHDNKTVTYEKDNFMTFTKWYNFAAALVSIFFVVGFQDYVVASSVVYLFFSRDRQKLGYPVFRSIRLALRYHLGSIAMFSAITKVNAAIAGILSKFSFKIASPCAVSRFCCAFLCKGFLNLLVAISERSYVTMSMFGMSFLKSGREAYLITYDHRSSFKEVLETGRHVIVFVRVLVLIVGFLVARSLYERLEHIQHTGFLLFFTMMLSYIVSCCFTAVFDLTLMAMSICYCLDCQLNDGVEKPYFMSPELIAFIKKADLNLKEVVIKKERRKIGRKKSVLPEDLPESSQ